ncbi:MAG: alcohol dehydrogenase catalytic domain-containing protein [Limisphaerales bacterium]
MRSVRLVRTGAPLELQELPVPTFGTGDVLIRVQAAGICHSDAHYRAGVSPVEPLPLTLGHEVAGFVEEVGSAVAGFKEGDRVCVHYTATCGHCRYCDRGTEQFCTTGKMIGKYRDGGFAEFISVPARSVFHLPPEIPFEVGAIMMCSSATSLHALNKTRLRAGESIALFGIGGLGISALQLAQAMGAGKVYAVDINPRKLDLAKRYGAIPVDAAAADPVQQIKDATGGRGVDVAIELIGLPLTMKQAVQSLGIMGRAGLVGLTQKTFEVAPYSEVLNKEAEIIGVSDHLASEIPLLLEFAATGKLRLADLIKTVPLDANAINQTLDALEKFGDTVRTVILPA